MHDTLHHWRWNLLFMLWTMLDSFTPDFTLIDKDMGMELLKYVCVIFWAHANLPYCIVSYSVYDSAIPVYTVGTVHTCTCTVCPIIPACRYSMPHCTCVHAGTTCTVRGRATARNASKHATCWRPAAVAAADLWNRDEIFRGETSVDGETAVQCKRHGTLLF